MNCEICSNKTKSKRNKCCSVECELLRRRINKVGWHAKSHPEQRYDLDI
jgi:hypothetical protein